MEVSLITTTPEGEKLIAYCARVSSPNQENPDYEKLLSYCIKHSHFSVFEQADMTLEIKTSRAIAAQILRHNSFRFQEFSQRYAQASAEFEFSEAREQDVKNRQASNDTLDAWTKSWFAAIQQDMYGRAYEAYEESIKRGIAKEQARMLLPLATTTKLYMKGCVRSWLHYCDVRCAAGTQKEHRDIAEACWRELSVHYPTVCKAFALDRKHLQEIK